jgi:hypothetical protein
VRLPQGKISLANGEERAVLELIPTEASEAHAADMIKTNLLRRARWATASLLLAGSVGAGTLLPGAGTAMAPEPARLNATLYSGSTPGVYVSSSLPTTVYFLSTSWTYSSVPAGAPCSPTAPIPAGSITTRVVLATGSYRRCSW